MPSTDRDHLTEILQRGDLTPEQEIRVFEMLENRRITQSSIAAEEEKAASQKWYNGTFVQSALGNLVGFAAAIGTVFAAYIAGVFGVQEATVTGQTTITDRQLQNEFSTFERLVSINVDELEASGGGSRNEERQRRVCMAITFGLIKVEPAILGVHSNDDPQTYSDKLSDFIDDEFKCSSVGYLPKTLGTPFDDWADNLSDNLRERGVSDEQLEQIRPLVTLDEQLLETQRELGTARRTDLKEYLRAILSGDRIALGKERHEHFRALLERIEGEYAIPAEVVVAMWGVETLYGTQLGDVHVMTALANMAYDGRRKHFFELQVMSLGEMIAEGSIYGENLKGSWAGAMGHMQFFPSSFAAYGVDFDLDGVRNPNSVADALASGANYLNKQGGWNPDLAWGYYIDDIGEFDGLGKGSEAPFSELVDRGIIIESDDLPPDDTMMSVIQIGDETPLYFAVTQNFKTLRKFNASSAYVVGIGLLSELIANTREVTPTWLE